MLYALCTLVPMLLVWFFLMKRNGPSFAALTGAAPTGPAPGATDFFARSGYRYAGMEQESLEAQAQRASSEGEAIVHGYYAVHYVRWIADVRVDFRQASFQARNLARFPGGESAAHGHGSFTMRGSRGVQNTTMACSWRVARQQPPAVLFHVAERGLGGSSLLGTRPWSPRAPLRFDSGLLALDQRFQLYAFEPDAARALLQGRPELVARLLECVEVDLWVDAAGAELADPELHNLYGGRENALRIPTDPAAHLQRMLDAHDRVTALLTSALS